MSAPLTSHLVHNGRNVIVQHEYLPASAKSLFHHSDDGTQQGLGGNDIAAQLSNFGNVDFFVSGRKGKKPNTYNCYVRVDVRHDAFWRTMGNVGSAATTVRDFFVGSSAQPAVAPPADNALGLSPIQPLTELPLPAPGTDATLQMPPSPTLIGDCFRVFGYLADYLVGGVYAGVASLFKKIRS